MGGLTITTYLINNPNLRISGVIYSAPFLKFHDRQNINLPKILLLKVLSTHLEVYLNFIVYTLI